MVVDEWIEETRSGTVKASHRDLGGVISEMKKGDILIVADITRVGRSLMNHDVNSQYINGKGMSLVFN